MSGTVGILNVGAGDTKLMFDKSNPAECIRAARIVKDMIRRGYALLVEVGTDAEGRPRYQRALDFDEAHCEYIIADLDPVQAAQADQQESGSHGQKVESEAAAEAGAQAAEPSGAQGPERRGRGRPRKRIPADGAKAVAVARTAGG